MKQNPSQITRATILGATLTILAVLAARAVSVQCGVLPKDTENATDKDVSNCPAGCAILVADKATYCMALSANPAYCSMLNWDGTSCKQDAWVLAYPGTCSRIGSAWFCTQVPGAPTSGPGVSPEPCLSGYDAELCPDG